MVSNTRARYDVTYLRAARLHTNFLRRTIDGIYEQNGWRNPVDDILKEGDYVKIKGGFDQATFAPLPSGMVGQIGVTYATGKMIEEYVKPGSTWGNYETVELPDPIPELRVRIVSNCAMKDEDIGIDGLNLAKVSAIEVLALQAE